MPGVEEVIQSVQWSRHKEMLAFWWGQCVRSGEPGHPALIPYPTHHFPSLLVLAVCGAGAEGCSGHWLTAQPHVICLPGQTWVNIQMDFCFVGTRGTWQHRLCFQGWGFAHGTNGHPGLWAVPRQAPEPPVTPKSWLILQCPCRELK